MRQALTNFSKGELAPELYGRIDTPQYRAGAKRIRNFIIQKYGGLAFRPGFRFVAPAEGAIDTPYRYVPFEFGLQQSYVLPLWGASMQALALGGAVLESDDLKIMAVSFGTTTTLTIPYHQMAVGERVYISGVNGTFELNNRFATIVAVPNGNQITVDINSTGFSPFIASLGIVRPGPPPPPPAPPAPPPPPPPPPPEPSTGSGSGTYIDRRRPRQYEDYV